MFSATFLRIASKNKLLLVAFVSRPLITQKEKSNLKNLCNFFFIDI